MNIEQILARLDSFNNIIDTNRNTCITEYIPYDIEWNPDWKKDWDTKHNDLCYSSGVFMRIYQSGNKFILNLTSDGYNLNTSICSEVKVDAVLIQSISNIFLMRILEKISTTPIKHLRLEKCILDVNASIALGNLLKNNTTIEYLTLEKITIDENYILHIAESINGNNISRLELHKTTMGNNERHMLDELINNINIKKLTVTINDNVCAEKIVKYLTQNSTLEYIYIIGIKNNTAEDIEFGAITNEKLTSIAMDNINMNVNGSDKLASLLESNSTITSICMKKCKLGNDSMKKIAHALKVNKSLRILKSERDYVTIGGLISLFESGNDSLEILRVTFGVNYTDIEMNNLLTLIKNNYSLLDFGDCNYKIRQLIIRNREIYKSKKFNRMKVAQ